ncbi:hypothetical protein FE840_020385 (plasmid) [Peteryoungia desertarenae]|uniref:Uncharacterized protein n=1 Tax=Peteryoungia desertarenae TaxID=1813451 RepID=A0ABX6QTR5_9HYPH|nr:hypothetical protein [Peteryoungia desertarenae]QLF71958.1 hypothetical protein FE840_020385 [Peteryoungia desertarenae]
MSKVVVIGLPGEQGLWVADLGNGTVSALQEPFTGTLGSADSLRGSGAAIVKGVDLALAFGSMEEIAQSHHEN